MRNPWDYVLGHFKFYLNGAALQNITFHSTYCEASGGGDIDRIKMKRNRFCALGSLIY